MNDMLKTIIPKSDQLNADDLIAGQTKTIKITKVSLVSGDQPVAINYDGDDGKPYKPGKSMRRVLVNCWGKDANNYTGRSLTLYRDDKVKFGGLDVGGIRISHMSDIAEPITMALTATKAVRKPFTVKPLIVSEKPSVDNWVSDIMTAPTMDGLKHKFSEAIKNFKDEKDLAKINSAKEKRKNELNEAAP